MSGATDRVRHALEQRDLTVRDARGGFKAQCPAHEDANPSLDVTEGRDGRALLCCRAGCEVGAVLDALGLAPADLFERRNGDGPRREVESYSYTDEQGSPLFEVVRLAPKDFRQRRPDGSWGIGDVRRVPYRLPRVLQAAAAGATVFVVEGERDVHAVERAGGVATCNPGGAGKWRAEYGSHFRGAAVVVVADRDEPGRKHAGQVAAALRPVAASVRIVEARSGKDAADHVAAGLALEQFADVTEPPADGPQGSAWEPTDLVPYLNGEARAVRPSILARSDGRCLLYPGKLHWLSGEPEAGKGWVALHACAERMNADERVVYIDFEDQAPTAIERLRALGVADELIAERFSYLAPEDRAADGDIGRLVALHPALVVADGVTEGMVLHGQDPVDNTAVAEWIGLVLRPFARAGASVLTLDHVVKRKDDRGRWAYGGQHKLAGVDVAYGVTVGVPMGRGRTGELHVVVNKDRPGFVRGFAHNGREAATITVRSSGDSVTVEVGAPGATAGSAEFRPTVLMERVSKALESADGLTGEGIRAAARGKAEYVDQARNLLVSEGRARVELDGRSKLYFSVEPYRESEDSALSVPHGAEPVPDEFVPPSRPALRGRPSRIGQDAAGTTPSRDLGGVDGQLATDSEEALLHRLRTQQADG